MWAITPCCARQPATPDALHLTGVTGAYPLDIDSDGHLDLVVLRVGENLLLRGGPDCGFTPFQGLGFASGARWTTAFSATWEAGQILATLALGNYVNRDDPKGPFRACDDNLLYRPGAAGYGLPLALTPGFCPLSMRFSDWGRLGRADLRISNDRHYYVARGQEQLWAMDDPPWLYSEADGWQDHQLWGMGIAARDLDRDGHQEVLLTSTGDQRLQYLDPDAGGPWFRDAPFDLGATAHRPYPGGDGRPSTGWHVAFGDVQNDGSEPRRGGRLDRTAGRRRGPNARDHRWRRPCRRQRRAAAFRSGHGHKCAAAGGLAGWHRLGVDRGRRGPVS